MLFSGLIGGSALLQFAMVLERQIQSACDGAPLATSAAANAEAEAFFAAPRNQTVSFHHCLLSQSEPVNDASSLQAASVLRNVIVTLRRPSEEGLGYCSSLHMLRLSEEAPQACS